MASLTRIIAQFRDIQLSSAVQDEYLATLVRSFAIYIAADLDTIPTLPTIPRVPPLAPENYARVNARIDQLHTDVYAATSMCLQLHDREFSEDNILGRRRPFQLDTLYSCSNVDVLLLPIFDQVVKTRWGRGFLDLCNADDLLCEEFKIFFLELIPQWPDSLLLCFAEPDGAEETDAVWMDRRAVAALHDLLLLRQYSAEDPRQEILRHTLIMILLDLVTPVPWRAVAFTLPRLLAAVKSLEEATSSFEKAYHPSPIIGSVMLWVLCIAMCAASTGEKTEAATEGVNWWRTRAMRLAMDLQIYTVGDMIPIMGKFLYCGVVLHSSIVDLFDRIAVCRLAFEEYQISDHDITDAKSYAVVDELVLPESPW